MGWILKIYCAHQTGTYVRAIIAYVRSIIFFSNSEFNVVKMKPKRIPCTRLSSKQPQLLNFESDVHRLIEEFSRNASKDSANMCFRFFRRLWKSRSFSFIHDGLPNGFRSDEFTQCLFQAALARITLEESPLRKIENGPENADNYVDETNSGNLQFIDTNNGKPKIRKTGGVLLRKEAAMQEIWTEELYLKPRLAFRVGAIYALYTLYFTQQSNFQRVRIYTTLEHLRHLTNTVRRAVARQPHHDIKLCLQQLIADRAIILGGLDPGIPALDDLHTVFGPRMGGLDYFDTLRTACMSYARRRSNFMKQIPEFQPVANSFLSYKLRQFTNEKQRILAHSLMVFPSKFKKCARALLT